MSTWSTICTHVTGLVLAPVVASLQRHGVLRALQRPDGATLEQLAAETKANSGPLSVVMRGLECEGLVARRPARQPMNTVLSLTALGHEVAEMPGLRAWTEQLAACPPEQRESEFWTPFQQRWDLPQTAAGKRWAGFFDGFVVLAPVLELRRRGCCASKALQSLGWLDLSGETTDRGRKGAKLGYTYLFPWSYRPLLASLDDLLFGHSSLFERHDDEVEGHLSRAEDISFSGTLSVDYCAAHSFPGLARRFDHEDLPSQPLFLADCGCGDGRLLAALGHYIAGQTRRGQHLDQHPLWLVGVDQEAVARQVAETTLAATGLRALVLPGDIADPDGLAVRLQEAGLDPRAGLHLSKSVLHDRTYHGPRDKEQARERVALSTGAFITSDNQPIDNADLEQDLVEVLSLWGPYTEKHGMLMFEAHTADPALIFANLERNWSPAFDIVQGLSHQYPMELPVLHSAMREAGYTIESWLDPTQGICGFATMSMNWLKWHP